MMEGAEVGSSNGLENRGNQYVVNGSMPSSSAKQVIIGNCNDNISDG